MHSVAALAAIAGTAAAAPQILGGLLPITLPSGITEGPTVLATFTPRGSFFSNVSCKIDEALFPGQPLHQLFGVSKALSTIVTPALRDTLGKNAVNDIDAAADELCVSAEQDKKDGDGICQFTLAVINDFVETGVIGSEATADKYRCLLNLLCVAPTGFEHPGTCQTLLAGVDCNANRLVSPDDPECTAAAPPPGFSSSDS